MRDELPRLRRIFVIEPPADGLPDDVAPYAELLAAEPADLDALGAATDPDDLATLIYTSGTTGPPKGVMISQHNVVFTCEELTRCYAFALGDDAGVGLRVVSYLPMAHIAERISSHYNAMRLGFTVTCCPDPSQIASYAREVHPEVMFGVPRVWEKVYLGVNAALAADPDKKKSFDEAVAAALPILEARRAGTITDEQQATWDFLDAVAFGTVRGLVGLDALRLGITGAAPIPREILEWFNAVGVPLSEIYGLSETTGPMTWEADPDRIKPGTVGPAIPGCEVRIADDGEVICRGDNVFQGYFKAPEKTADALDRRLVPLRRHRRDGRRRLPAHRRPQEGADHHVGRQEHLAGQPRGGAEDDPADRPGVRHRRRPQVRQRAARARPGERGGVGQGARPADVSLAELADDPDVRAEVQAGVDAVNRQFAQVEQIKKFVLIGEEWLPDSDMLTPTSKLRNVGASHAQQHHAADAKSKRCTHPLLVRRARCMTRRPAACWGQPTCRSVGTWTLGLVRTSCDRLARMVLNGPTDGGRSMASTTSIDPEAALATGVAHRLALSLATLVVDQALLSESDMPFEPFTAAFSVDQRLGTRPSARRWALTRLARWT